MVLQCTLTVQTARVCVGKSREEIVDEVSKGFSIHPVVAIQVGFDIIRVTFHDSDSCKLARNNTHVNIFGSNCIVQGGGPPSPWFIFFTFLPNSATSRSDRSFRGTVMLDPCDTKNILADRI